MQGWGPAVFKPPIREDWMSASNDAFAVHLYRELARSSGDVLFSPWCLAQVLAMLQLGAAGHTRAEIAAY